MYKIFFYKDKSGREPILDYLRELKSRSDKSSRIKLNKLNDYIHMLSTYGTSIGEPYIKRVSEHLWELRPLRDRIFFVSWADSSYVLLHHFFKKTQKTPKREIEKAERKLADLYEREGITNE